MYILKHDDQALNCNHNTIEQLDILESIEEEYR